MAHHQQPAAGLHQLPEASRLSDVGGHRLLDEDVLAALERRGRRLVVAGRLGGNDDSVHIGGRDQLGELARGPNVAVAPASLAQPIGADVAGGD